MEKRTERNKDLYRQIDEEIILKQKETDNASFDSTQSTLLAINPDLFGNGNKNKIEEKKTFNKWWIISIALIVILIVVLVVTILWITKD